MQQDIVVPYLRDSPVYDSRRDLVAHSSESFTLRVTVIERDDPNAPLLLLTDGLGGPAAQLIVWADYDPGCRRCDYGRPPQRGVTLYSAWGEPQAGLGAFEFFLPAGTLYTLPPRCGWGVLLVWGDSMRADMLHQGRLHVLGAFGPGAPPDAAGDSLSIMTHTSLRILTHTGQSIIT